MEYFMENIVWFIVGAIIILMTIVGYLADKGTFSKKDEKPKNKIKEQNKKEKVVEEIEEDSTAVDAFTPIVNTQNLIPDDKNEEEIEDLYAPINSANKKVEDNEESNADELLTPLHLDSIDSTMSVPEEPVENTDSVIENSDVEEATEDLYVPLSNNNIAEEEEAPTMLNDSNDVQIDSEDLYTPTNSEVTEEVPTILEEPVEEVTEDLYTPLTNKATEEVPIMLEEPMEENNFADNKIDNDIIKENIFGEAKDIEKDKVSYDDFLTDMPIIIDDNAAQSSSNVSASDSELLVNDDNSQNEDIWKF